jgi:hypothetical protein
VRMANANPYRSSSARNIATLSSSDARAAR